ncbi:MAG TPA: glycosyltransferase family 39 protein, partial [Vicinamibacterales bacterium]|nr:glycosyltransferase family 39 protein [Vicinamibacterales bacterium]
MSRLGLALVVALFGIPLFIGLGSADLKNDEAIYSYAVDSILELGDWLAPKSSPNPTIAFLEKPPLKFWIVAAPIQAGLLPHDEFGLRFWDAFFGAIAFLYVFALGRRIGGPICGAVSVLLLCVHRPLLFEHGLRENTMEAALVLAYCGGAYHYLRWADGSAQRAHAVAVALFFALGFLTKFVASLFLPLVLGIVTLAVPSYRSRLRRDWRPWLAAGAAAALAIVPWFVHAHVRFGQLLWDVMFRDHVYHRFTTYVDPRHLQPWSFYFDTIIVELEYAHVLGLVGVGLLVFVADMIRLRRPEGVLILCWFLLPLAMISSGSSKLYHYAYPFLPPLAIAGGYLPAVFWKALTWGVAAAARWVERRAASWRATLGRPAVRHLLVGLALTSAAVALVTMLYGPIRVRAGGYTLFRNTSITRPSFVAVLAVVVAGAPHWALRPALVPLLLLLLPIDAYRDVLGRLDDGRAPLRDVRDCVRRLQSSQLAPERGTFVDMPEQYFQHQYYYYFRSLGPWERSEDPMPALIYQRLFEPSEQRPVLVAGEWYGDTLHRLRAGEASTLTEVAQQSGVDAATVRERAADASTPMIGFNEVL